jgi:hypothetical protein
VERQRLVPFLLEELTRAPELWAQKSYLARVVDADGTSDIQPLAHFLDVAGPDGVAVAVEANADGDVYPAVYVKRNGDVSERLLQPHHLHDFRGPDYERELGGLL